jgi:hypothetical protein
MPRKMQIQRSKTVVYLDDVEEQEIDAKTGNLKWVDDDETVPKMEMVCKAIEVNGDLPVEGCTTFQIQSIPLQETLKVGQLARSDRIDEAVYKVLRRAIIGWDNLAGPDGQPYKFKPERIDTLPTEEASALANFLMERATAKRADRAEGKV